MIRLARGAEPATLASARAKKLSAAVAAVEARTAPTIDGYDVAKADLYRAQHKKCAFCERRTDFSSAPTEHFRPKKGALRHESGQATAIDESHYWWLAWTWENLLFACVRCNDQAHKGNWFPLVAGTTACRPPSKAVRRSLQTLASWGLATEQAALLDPACESGLDHFVWRPVDATLPRATWIWAVAPLTERGRRTMRVLKLEELAEDVGNQVRVALLPSVEEIEAHLADGALAKARGRWDALLRDTFAPGADLTAAMWCALEVLLPATARASARLSSPPRP